jgi:hypothetical protein
MEQNMEWTTEIGNAFSSDQKAVLNSVQRLRAQAKSVGNLKTTPEQEVKTETQNGQTVIVVQPANPQVVYVPQYNPETVYTEPPPPKEDDSGKAVAAALVGFALGVALGAAANDSYGYYGWGSWGMHWHRGVVVVHSGVWRVPPHGRYPYARPLPAYRPPVHVAAPRYSHINVNIDRSRNVNINNANVNRQSIQTGTRTPRPTTLTATPARTTQATAATAVTNRSQQAGNAYRGRTQASSARAASPVQQLERGSSTSAFSSYQRKSSTQAASSRGRRSAQSQNFSGRRR